MRRLWLVVLMHAILGSRGAVAESWYVIKADSQAAVIMDADSRKLDQDAFITTRDAHPGIRPHEGVPIVATQFRLEFDCKGNRFRTIDFAAIDLDGHVPAGLESDKVRDWGPIEADAPTSMLKQFACEGQLPAKPTGPYPFIDIESKYLMWLQYGAGKDFSEYMLQSKFP